MASDRGIEIETVTLEDLADPKISPMGAFDLLPVQENEPYKEHGHRPSQTSDKVGRHNSDKVGRPTSDKVVTDIPRYIPDDEISASEKNQQFLQLFQAAMNRCQMVNKNEIKIDYQKELTLLKTLGEGAFGVVNCCMYTPAKEKFPAGSEVPAPRKVAVKHLREGVEAIKLEIGANTSVEVKPVMEADVTAFVNEIFIQSKLDNPYIVRFIGYGVMKEDDAKSSLFLVEEYLPHRLSHKLHSNKSMKQALQWSLEIAKGMRYIHGAKPIIMHRDLKPDNVLLSEDNVAKITDFGLFTTKQGIPENMLSSEKDNFVFTDMSTHHGGNFFGGSVHKGNAFGSHHGGNHFGSHHGGTAFGSHHGGVMYANRGATAGGSAHGGSLYQSSKERDKDKERGPSTHSDGSGGGGSFCSNAPYLPTGQTGALRYMAPENYNGFPYDEKVDQYAFSMVMYALVKRNEAFADMYLSPLQIAEAAATRGLRPTCNPNWPNEVVLLLQDCWHEEPAKRPTFADIVKRLKGILDNEIVMQKMEDSTKVCACCIIA